MGSFFYVCTFLCVLLEIYICKNNPFVFFYSLKSVFLQNIGRGIWIRLECFSLLIYFLVTMTCGT